MSDEKALAIPNQIEKVLIQGDLTGLTESERVVYVQMVCKSMGLNLLTKPFEFIKLNGKLVLYATRSASDQLRKIYGISVNITAREMIGDIYVVTARGRTPDGREDEATGAVNVKGLSGEAMANAYLKAETKAKRRLTLSLCSLGMLDETEVNEGTASRSRTREVQQTIHETVARPEYESVLSEQSEPEVRPEVHLTAVGNSGDYIFKTGKDRKGKRVKDMLREKLEASLAQFEHETAAGKSFAPEIEEDFFNVSEYLKSERE